MKIKTRALTVAATLGLFTTLTACSGGTEPAPEASSASPEVSASETASPTASDSSSPEASPSASATTYRKPSTPEQTTSTGESVQEAEKRFVEYATGTIKTKKTADEILETGYKLCHFFSEEGTLGGVIERVTQDAVNVEEESENLQMSGAAIKTICPEHKDVN